MNREMLRSNVQTSRMIIQIAANIHISILSKYFLQKINFKATFIISFYRVTMVTKDLSLDNFYAFSFTSNDFSVWYSFI